MDVYSLEMITAISFRICSRESTFFRKYVLKKLLRENKNINYLLLGLNEKNGSYSNPS